MEKTNESQPAAGRPPVPSSGLMAHTPGPWYAHCQEIQGEKVFFVSNGRGLFSEKPHAVNTTYGPLCGIQKNGADDRGKPWPAEANANLIAAAPDLLQATAGLLMVMAANGLYVTQEHLEWAEKIVDGEPRKVADVVTAAIAKSMGQNAGVQAGEALPDTSGSTLGGDKS